MLTVKESVQAVPFNHLSTRLDPEEKKIIRSVIESMMLRHEARRWSTAEKSG
jgi:hypothetical protein